MTVEEALSKELSYHAGDYDVAVVGAGHAGCEAAHACAKLGLKTILFTLALDSLANLPCNPSIGGTSKGQLVREVDALGGIAQSPDGPQHVLGRDEIRIGESG